MTALLATALVAQPAAAQVGVFGTWVRYGDADYYLPVTKQDALNLRVNFASMGNDGVQDDCVILDTGSLFSSSPGAGAQTNDLRLTGCFGKAPGTKITDADGAEKAATYTPTTVKVSYADVSGNSKYDKGEPVYVTTSSTNALVGSVDATTWTVRLTAYQTYAAGTFVYAGDADFSAYGAAARNQSFGVTEREDKAIYLVPNKQPITTAGNNLLKGSMVPEKSLRMLAGVQDMPDVKPVSLEVLSPEIKVGEKIKVKVTLENLGKLAGWGLAAVKLDGIVLDVKPTIVLSPGERTSVILSSFVPPVSASAKLEAGEVMEFVDVIDENETPESASAEQVNELLTKITALEAKIAALEEQQEIRALEVAGEPQGNSPGLDLVSLALVAGLALFAFRRRSQL